MLTLSVLLLPFCHFPGNLNSKLYFLDNEWVNNSRLRHCLKSVRIWSYSGPYFPAFGLYTKRYFVSLRIQSEGGKILTRITPNMDAFYEVRMIGKKIDEP